MTTQFQPPKRPVEVDGKLPSSDMAERAVIGAILITPKLLDDIADLLTPSDFFFRSFVAIYSAFLELREQNLEIGSVSVMEQLIKNGTLEVAGGVAGLSALADEIPSARLAYANAKTVKQKSVLRSIIHSAHALEQESFKPTAEASRIAEQGVDFFSNILRTSEGPSISTRLQASLDLLKRLETLEDSKILTGIPELDDILGGFMPGELIVYTAHTGVGKSFFAMQTAKVACGLGAHGLYCSGEMLAAHLMGRELISATGIKSWKLRRPSRLTMEELTDLSKAAMVECSDCVILDGELNLSNIWRAARATADRKKLNFIMVDYDELVEVQGEDEIDEQRTLTRELKNIAMELHVPVIEISQLRKALNSKQRMLPRLADLYGSGAKSKHASIVIYIDRPYVQNLKGDETEATVSVLKSRDGRQGKISCTFNIKTFRFEQEEKDRVWAERR